MKQLSFTLFFSVTALLSFSQNVGIGTTTPAYLLHVTGSTAYTGFFENTAAGNSALYGMNSTVAGTGTGCGVLGTTNQANTLAAGVFGQNYNSTGTGVMGAGNNQSPKSLTAGSGAAFTGTGIGLVAYGTTTAGGTGVLGSGNNVSLTVLTNGSGGAFSGSSTGVFARATSLAPNGINQGIYTSNIPLATNVAVNYYDGIQQYKIIGNGSVSTIVKDIDEKRVIMYAPESPEVYFQDFGQGHLVNGRVHINIDPTFAKNVLINERHPLRVFIQPEGDCKGTFVTNKTAAGFDVVELDGGNSNISFQWSITCNRADEQLANGHVSRNADARFRPAPVPEKEVNIDIKK